MTTIVSDGKFLIADNRTTTSIKGRRRNATKSHEIFLDDTYVTVVDCHT